MTLSDQVHGVVVDALGAIDVEIYDFEHVGSTVRVTLDRPDGIDVDTVAQATRAISRALDAADPIPGAYTLEVSSPGLERTLRTPAHWVRAIGERVKVKSAPGSELERRIEGTIIAADGDRVTVRPDDGDDLSFDIGLVERARTVFEWGPAPKPGGPKPGKQAGTRSGSGRTKETRT